MRHGLGKAVEKNEDVCLGVPREFERRSGDGLSGDRRELLKTSEVGDVCTVRKASEGCVCKNRGQIVVRDDPVPRHANEVVELLELQRQPPQLGYRGDIPAAVVDDELKSEIDPLLLTDWIVQFRHLKQRILNTHVAQIMEQMAVAGVA